MSHAEHICERCGCDATADYYSDERCNTAGIGVCLCEVCAKLTATLSDEAFKAGGWRLGYCCRYHATGGPPQYPCGGWDHVKLRKLEPRQPNPLMVALERAYRARGAFADAAQGAEPVAVVLRAAKECQDAELALWLACDAAWGPTQTHIEPKGPNGE